MDLHSASYGLGWYYPVIWLARKHVGIAHNHRQLVWIGERLICSPPPLYAPPEACTTPVAQPPQKARRKRAAPTHATAS